jgi:hypothetical protein
MGLLQDLSREQAFGDKSTPGTVLFVLFDCRKQPERACAHQVHNSSSVGTRLSGMYSAILETLIRCVYVRFSEMLLLPREPQPGVFVVSTAEDRPHGASRQEQGGMNNAISLMDIRNTGRMTVSDR